VLHDRSFIDDATRILRAIRYEQRLGFRLEDDTETLLSRDLAMLDTISGDRLRKELHLLLKEVHCANILLRAEQLGVMAAIHPSLSRSGRVVQGAVGSLEKTGLDEQVYLGLLAYPQDQAEGEQFIGRLRMPPRWATVVRDTIALKGKLAWLSDAGLSPAQLYEALSPSTPAAVQACALASPSEEARRHLSRFLEKLRHVKPSLGGRDLIELGVPQGPAIGEMLVRLRSARLEGAATGRAEEVALVENWLATQQT
jgi:tRNA nucleotidyltransferase (CCA-adding enzyme)